MCVNPLFQNMGNIKMHEEEARVIIGLACYHQTLRSPSPIARADLLQTSLGELMKIYLACAPKHNAKEKDGSSSEGMSVVSVMQEKGLAGPQVQVSLLLQDSGAL